MNRVKRALEGLALMFAIAFAVMVLGGCLALATVAFVAWDTSVFSLFEWTWVRISAVAGLFLGVWFAADVYAKDE